jgi:hypothetical protein
MEKNTCSRIRLQCFCFPNRFYYNASLNWNEDHLLLPSLISHVCTMVNCLYQHFPPHKMMPMFFILGSICLSLSDMAAATVAPAAASTTSWKWRTIILDKQQIQGWQINYTPSSFKTSFKKVMPLAIHRVRRGRDRMVFGLTTTYAISANHH